MTEKRSAKAAWMFAKIDEWKESGLTKQDFCTLHNIEKSTLDYWIQQMKKSQYKTPRFIELVAQPMSTGTDSNAKNNHKTSEGRLIEFNYPDGLCIKMYL